MVLAIGDTLSIDTPFRNARDSEPISAPSPLNASEYPTNTQRIDTRNVAARHCAMVASTFFLRTMPA